MARRRRNDADVIELALAAPWQLSAVLCVVVLLGTAIFKAALAKNQFAPMLLPIFDMGGGLLALLFGGVAAAKLIYRLFIRCLPQRASFSSTPSQPRAPWRAPRKDPGAAAFIAALGKPQVWNLDVIQRMEWKRFEDVCVAWCRARGIRAESTPLGADGGVDIRLYENPADPLACTAIVQCKAWANYVGVAPVRELRGVMAHEEIVQGFFIAQSGFSADAQAFARENRIELIDGPRLLGLIGLLALDAAQSLLELATEGDWTTPTCGHCGIKMVAREGKSGSFWGCRNFPRCRQRIGMRGG